MISPTSSAETSPTLIKKVPVNPFIPKKKKPVAMQTGRPIGPSAASAAKKAREEEAPAPADTPGGDASAPVVDADPASWDNTSMTVESLHAANQDYYNKLTERDETIARLEGELRENATTIENQATNNANLQKEVKQYTKELREVREMLVSSQNNVTKMRTGQNDAYKKLDKDHKDTSAALKEADTEIENLKNDIKKRRSAHNKLVLAVEGGTQDAQKLRRQLDEAEAKVQTLQESQELVDSICREFESAFTEMNRDLNPATILNHIHELQTAASKPRRKANRKVSIADELVDHSDIDMDSAVGSEQGDDSPQPAVKDSKHITENVEDPSRGFTAEELAEAESQIDANTAAESRTTRPTPQSVDNRAKVDEIMAFFEGSDDSSPTDSPVHTFDFQKELAASIKRYKEAEAALAVQTARVAEFEKAESERVNLAIEEADAAAANQTKAAETGAAEMKRVAEKNAADKSTADAEKLRLTNEVTRLTARVKLLEDRLSAMPRYKLENDLLTEKATERTAVHKASLKAKDDAHSASMKAKDAQVAQWQADVNEAQSNGLVITEVEDKIAERHIVHVREKTTLEWLCAAPLWWQLFLGLMLMLLIMGNLSAWMERHAWVTANTFAMDHVRARAHQGIRGPSAATLWFENLIGFDRRLLG